MSVPWRLPKIWDIYWKHHPNIKMTEIEVEHQHRPIHTLLIFKFTLIWLYRGRIDVFMTSKHRTSTRLCTVVLKIAQQLSQTLGLVLWNWNLEGIFIIQTTHRPVIVEMAQFIGQSLDVVGLETEGVMDDVVVGGGHGSLSDTLTHQEEVIPAKQQPEVYVQL